MKTRARGPWTELALYWRVHYLLKEDVYATSTLRASARESKGGICGFVGFMHSTTFRNSTVVGSAPRYLVFPHVWTICTSCRGEWVWSKRTVVQSHGTTAKRTPRLIPREYVVNLDPYDEKSAGRHFRKGDTQGRSEPHGRRLAEPYVQKFRKFNSNTGVVKRPPCVGFASIFTFYGAARSAYGKKTRRLEYSSYPVVYLPISLSVLCSCNDSSGPPVLR